MDEKELVSIWNQQRVIRVKSQLAPTVLSATRLKILGGLFVLMSGFNFVVLLAYL